MNNEIDPRVVTMLAMLRDYYRASGRQVIDRWGEKYAETLFGRTYDDHTDSRLHAHMFAWAVEQLLISMGVDMTPSSLNRQEFNKQLEQVSALVPQLGNTKYQLVERGHPDRIKLLARWYRLAGCKARVVRDRLYVATRCLEKHS